MSDEKQVDVVLARVTQLPSDELYGLYAAIGKEVELRKDAEQTADWKAVEEAIDKYVCKWGSIIVEDNCDGDSVYLGRGNYTYGTSGIIDVR